MKCARSIGQCRHRVGRFILTSLVLLTFGSPLHAGTPYLGLGVGPSWSTFDTTNNTHVAFNAKDLSSKNTALRFFAGWQFIPNFGAEIGYISFLAESRLAPQQYGSERQPFFTTKVSGFEIAPVGAIEIDEHFVALARAGLIMWHSSMSYNDGSPNADLSETKSGVGLSLAVGGKYAVSANIGVRVEYVLNVIDKAKAGKGPFNAILLSGQFTL